jgi:hypothetical protein
MAALALIKRAEALRAELHFRGVTVSERDMTTQINEAKGSYNEALEKSFLNPSLTAIAKFGLGLCEEELDNFDEARRIYRDIVATAGLESTTAFVQAKQRLDTMADYNQKVVFGPSPKPKPAPPARVTPPVTLGPLDVNLAETNLGEANLSDDKLVDVNWIDTPSTDTNLDDMNLAGP